jgi:hypothetical protein
MYSGTPLIWRWNFVSAMQTSNTSITSDGVTLISKFATHFSPERIRCAIISPDWQGNYLAESEHTRISKALYKIPRTDVLTVDTRQKEKNGLMYADFFDFT